MQVMLGTSVFLGIKVYERLFAYIMSIDIGRIHCCCYILSYVAVAFALLRVFMFM